MTLTVELASKVTAAHLGRDAYVYVRQSTLTQMREHTESLERQYELASRAQALGWPPRQVVVVDEDLGRSGADATAREGSSTWWRRSGWARSGSSWVSRCPAWPVTTRIGISCWICAR